MSDHQPEREDAWHGGVSSPLDIVPVQPLSSVIAVDVGAVSSAGVAQRSNTDHYLALRFGRLQETVMTSLAAADLPRPFEEFAYALLVADGLGGHAGGARASRLALSTLAHLAIEYGHWNVRVQPETRADIVEQGEFLYRQVNDAMRHARASDVRLADMATSLTAAYIAGADLFFAHVGHSKAFLFRNGELVQLTKDHTAEQHRPWGRRPPWPEESTPDEPHVLTQTIGGSPWGPDVAIEHVHLWSGDRVLLCTNGLTDFLCGDIIATVLGSPRRPAEDCRRLVDRALEAGSTDDVTVLLADYSIRRAPVIAQSGNGH